MDTCRVPDLHEGVRFLRLETTVVADSPISHRTPGLLNMQSAAYSDLQSILIYKVIYKVFNYQDIELCLQVRSYDKNMCSKGQGDPVGTEFPCQCLTVRGGQQGQGSHYGLSFDRC